MRARLIGRRQQRGFLRCPVSPSAHHPLLSLFANDAQNKVASKGRGILAMDESNATCGKRLESIGLENTEDNRCAAIGVLGLRDCVLGGRARQRKAAGSRALKQTTAALYYSRN